VGEFVGLHAQVFVHSELWVVPGTDNCGVDGILDPVLDLDKSLPSPAGSNTAILSGSSYTAPAKLIRKYLG
jgi:hypothetical protein